MNDALFLGTYCPRLDAQGRFQLPAAWRKQCRELALYLFTDPAPHIVAITEDFKPGFTLVRPDPIGVVKLPEELRLGAGITREVILAGMPS